MVFSSDNEAGFSSDNEAGFSSGDEEVILSDGVESVSATRYKIVRSQNGSGNGTARANVSESESVMSRCRKNTMNTMSSSIRFPSPSLARVQQGLLELA